MHIISLIVVNLMVGIQAEPRQDSNKDITGNQTVRLVATRISRKRGQNLEAKFVVVDSAKPGEIFIRFASHSHTTHETTLMNIVKSCGEWSEPTSKYEWHDARLSATFSIPKDASGYVTDYGKWWFVSFGDLEKK